MRTLWSGGAEHDIERGSLDTVNRLGMGTLSSVSGLDAHASRSPKAYRAKASRNRPSETDAAVRYAGTTRAVR